MTDHPPAEQQPDELAELRTENAKLIRWHREDEKALAEMRDTIEHRQAEQAARTVPDTLPAWLYQRFAVIHGAPAWDRVADDQRAYWEHQARAVRRAVARGGFKTASEATGTPLRASQPSSVSESAQSPTGAAERALRHSLPVEASEVCGKCKQPFDLTDTSRDGRNRFYLTPYCRRCVDRCHDTEIADHRCVICA